MARPFFTINSADGSVDAVIFHDQIAAVETRAGHAYITLASGYHIELMNLTTDAIVKVIKEVR